MISVYEFIDILEGDVELCQDNLDIAMGYIKDVVKDKSLSKEARATLKKAYSCIKNVNEELDDLFAEVEDDDEDDEEDEDDE